MDRNNAQAPTIIPPKSRITVVIIPSENIEYSDGWHEGKLFEGDAMSQNGKEFSVYFPMEYRGVKKEYSFKFKMSVTNITE